MAELKDSGERTQYATGAVRDCKEGKGRFDLMPLDILYMLTGDAFFSHIDDFKNSGNIDDLKQAFDSAVKNLGYTNSTSEQSDIYGAFLEVAKHFEDGARKYGENNWQKGIPLHSYIDSALRHYTKYMCNWVDEPHHRACLWNLMCGMWTLKHQPELNDFTKGVQYASPALDDIGISGLICED